MKKLLLFITCLLFLSNKSFSGLGAFYNTTKQGLNYAVASANLNGRFAGGTPQPATLAIAGIPAGAVIEAAYLYWVVESDATGTGKTVTLKNPSGTSASYTGTSIGTAAGKCWGRSTSQNFRATVTASVTGTVNGAYMISGLPRVLSPGLAGSDTDGATLIIIYSDCRAMWKGTLVIKDGIDVYNDKTDPVFNSTQNVSFAAAPAGVFNSSTFCLISDFQNLGAVNLQINGGAVPYTQNFWDWKNGINPITSGQSSVNFSVTQVNPASKDCYDWILAGAYYQFCSPPPLTISATTVTCGSPTVFTPLICTVAPPSGLSYSWTGSGGFSSSASNPSYTYATSGTYTASLAITDAATGCTATAGTISVTVNTPCAAIPIELISFTGKAEGNSALLEWSTATELNYDHFEIERSLNGTNFSIIAVNEGQSSSTIKQYKWFDHNLASGTYYYRLKEVDLNGRYVYSSVIPVSLFSDKLSKCEVKYLSQETLLLHFDAIVREGKIRIFDVLGKECSSQQLSLNSNEFQLNIENLKKGIYFIQIESQTEKITSKFIR